MANIKIRYFKWRNGRPRWEPGPTVRALGFKGQNLKDEAGNWLDKIAAITAAEILNAELDDFRLGQPAQSKPKYITERTVNALFQHYFASQLFTDLAPRTQRDYRYNATKFLAVFGDAPVRSLTKPTIYEYYDAIRRHHGLTMSAAIIATARAALSYAEIIGWIAENTNPALRLKIKKAPPRTVLYLPNEAAHLVQCADNMGLHSVGDAIIIAVQAGQRPTDTLLLPDHIFTKDRILLTQSKSGSKIDIAMTPMVQSRIAEIYARKQAKQHLSSIEALIIYEQTGHPYVSEKLEYRNSQFPKKFRQVRKEAAKTMPALKNKVFQDFRDTAVTRLALANCNKAEICAITGHSQARADEIIRHYMVLTTDMADSAINKLNIWMQKEGIEI